MGSGLSAQAGVLDFLGVRSVKASSVNPSLNSQTMPLLENKLSPDLTANNSAHSPLSIVDDNALLAESGPLGTVADVEHFIPENDTISIYIVRAGDSISEIAEMFDVSVNTILWANNLERGKALKEGETLVILPISGVRHTIKKGDTIALIAKKYNGDAKEIAQFNDLDVDSILVAGQTIIIPNGEITAAPAKAKVVSGVKKGVTTVKGYFMRPISGGRRTQGIHGNNGVDLATATGSPVYAAASGTVIVAKGGGGWNGGYGNYVVIKHGNGTQTLYAHLNTVAVSTGATVSQGDVIGGVGNTGKSTAPHLHFEVRGASNPF